MPGPTYLPSIATMPASIESGRHPSVRGFKWQHPDRKAATKDQSKPRLSSGSPAPLLVSRSKPDAHHCCGTFPFPWPGCSKIIRRILRLQPTEASMPSCHRPSAAHCAAIDRVGSEPTWRSWPCHLYRMAHTCTHLANGPKSRCHIAALVKVCSPFEFRRPQCGLTEPIAGGSLCVRALIGVAGSSRHDCSHWTDQPGLMLFSAVTTALASEGLTG